MAVLWYAYFQASDGKLVSEGTEDDRNLHPLPVGIDRTNTYADPASREAGMANRERWDEATRAMAVVPESRADIHPSLGPGRAGVASWDQAVQDAAAAGQSTTELTRSRDAAQAAYLQRLQDYEDAPN